MRSPFSVASLLAYSAPALATISYTQSDSNLNFNMFTTSQGSNTDLHINMSIPSSNGWGGIGVGDGMIGALMFIVLPDSTNGSTISVRSTSGYVMPKPLSGINFEITGGSADNNVLMASGICHSCQSWSSGTLNPTSTSQPFIWAVGPGTQGVSGTGQNANIQMHSNMGTFAANMVQAAVAPSSSSSSSSGGGSSSGGDSSSGGSSSSGTSGSSSGGSSGVTTSTSLRAPSRMMVVAHAVLFILAFLLLYPLGVFFLRLPGLGSWKIHAGIQVVASALTVAGLGVAIHMSMGTYFGKFNKGHQGVGLTAASLALLQLLTGIVHHLGYKKFQSRWAVTYFHLAAGPIAMALGVINPILGFLLTMKRSAAIGVGVVGCVIWVVAFAFAWSVGARKSKTAVVDKGSDSERNINSEMRQQSS